MHTLLGITFIVILSTSTINRELQSVIRFKYFGLITKMQYVAKNLKVILCQKSKEFYYRLFSRCQSTT